MALSKVELEATELVPEPRYGHSDVVEADHQPHVFLYVPDLSAQAGWSSHRVPERAEKTERRRPMGFQRR